MNAADVAPTPGAHPVHRIGVLIPPANVQCEQEYPGRAPAGFSFHFTRLIRPHAELTAESLVEMKASAQDAALRLSSVEPLAFAYACTSGSFLSGSQAHGDIAQDIAGATGIPAVTTATAVLEALDALAVKRVAVVTPYPLSITQQAVRFLEEHGMQVTHVDTYDYVESRRIAAITGESVARRVQAVSAKAADAVFISCTNVQTFNVLSSLESDIGKPVVSSNSATLWAALRLAGYEGSITGIGRLGSLARPAA